MNGMYMKNNYQSKSRLVLYHKKEKEDKYNH